METITAVVIDGFHAGHTMRMEYYPTLTLLKPKIVKVDYCCPGYDDALHDEERIVYKECFRAVDRKMVLYSVKGESMNLIGKFPHTFTDTPWSERTTLYMGYHDEPVRRKEEEITNQTLN